ncbi:unnamed protein product [Lymnaea stagnalis]|uniref:Uncharacterized protein n=1 Tax=Lymnaea stagnalis TaxID=6523 RepID=A0AAV2H6X9_LYMST
MERINPRGGDLSPDYANDDADRRDKHVGDGSRRQVIPNVNDASPEKLASERSDWLGQSVHRKTRAAAPRDGHQGQGHSVHALARVVVERLSSRIQYLKKSLAECYVAYSKWNIRHS